MKDTNIPRLDLAGVKYFTLPFDNTDIHVVNASNTCVTWDRSNLHGIGRYEEGLEHIGIAILLSDESCQGTLFCGGPDLKMKMKMKVRI